MINQSPAVSRFPFGPSSVEFKTRSQAGAKTYKREQWVMICAGRLSQLRPDHHRAFIASVAEDLWGDVSSFDPMIAAELEHESWLADA